MNYTVVINSATWLGALAYYYLDARKWFTGPKITIDTDDLSEAQQQAFRDEGLEIRAVGTGNENGSGEGGVGKREKGGVV